MRGPRSDTLNEKYYARRQHPNFRQFARRAYHFTDEHGRQYTLAARNNEVFQNHNLQARPLDDELLQPRQCEIDQYDRVTLYVRLPTLQHQWFTQQELYGEAVLYPRDKKNKNVYVVTLCSAFKEQERVGVVTVQGLAEEECNALLNKAL